MESHGDSVYTAARRAYIGNYLIAGLVLLLMVIILTRFNLSFDFTSGTVEGFYGVLVTLGFLSIVSFLMEEPLIEGMRRKYVITSTEVVKVEGIVSKAKHSLSYLSIMEVIAKVGYLGRLLNYGDVEIRSGRETIVMKNMANPNEIQRVIQNKIALIIKKPKKDKLSHPRLEDSEEE